MTPSLFIPAARQRQRPVCLFRAAGLLLAFFLLRPSAFAEQTLRLWGDQPPSGYRTEKAEVAEDNRRDPAVANRSYSLVSEPTLTFFPAPERNTAGPCVLVLPGGGYRTVVFDKEGTEVARWLNGLGMSAAVLKYRTRDPEKKDLPGVLAATLDDARQAMRVLRGRAAEWKIDPKQVGAIGFSAGGDLALRLTLEPAPAAESAAYRPDFVALVYAGGRLPDRSNLAGPLPPFFIVHAADDSKVPVMSSVVLFGALQEAGVRAELHVYSKGEHGFALRSNGEVRSWPDLFRAWAGEQGFLSGAPAR
ncbi:xylanase [Opitutaceae bacterium EW11]|nr:xylanase [Opitutaceae bacterium EW11]